MPKITIILPTYNGCKYLKQSIGSVLEQDFQDWELIVMDDCSTDETKKVVSDFLADSRIKYFKNERNLGLQKTLNVGLKNSTGEYVARIDDDDSWTRKDKLSKQLSFLETNKAHVLTATWFEIFDVAGQVSTIMKTPSDDGSIRKCILTLNPFCHSSVMFKRSAAEECGNYDEKLKYTEDWDLWLRLGKKGKMKILEEVSVKYLSRNSGMSRSSSPISQFKWHLRIFIKYFLNYPCRFRSFVHLIKLAGRIIIPKR